ncbi:MAG TPA: hypothetical protein VMA73_28170 [Streptosporangiaceae bacterium]|nr:hypothetical protein [Streptosporangiaceae bacterium]
MATDNRQYTVFGSENVVNTGDHGQVNYAKGDKNNQAASSTVAGPWDEVAEELDRIRLRLESVAASDDRDDALDCVRALSRDLPDLRQSGSDGRKNLRQRIKALIGVLTPVAGLIGGVAALQSICQHL